MVDVATRPAPDDPLSLRERRRIETGAEIVAAARRLFARDGYADTRTSDIAAAAGVSDATLFRYFPCKSAIALAGVAGRITFAIERFTAQPPDLGEVDAARSALRDILDLGLFGADDPVVHEVTLVGTAPELWDALNTMINEAARELTQAVAHRSGRSTPTLVDRVRAHAILGAVQAAAEDWFLTGPDRPVGDIVDEAFALAAPA